MYYWQEKNLKIDENSKILIGLGDSFTQGQGACSIDIWEKYNWKTSEMYLDQNIDVLESQYKNSFINKICDEYLLDFIPINFGMMGRGNRAAANELFLHPELNIERAKEKIVIFMLSGKERFDFVHKDFAEHVHFKTIWPSIDSNNPEKNFFENYLNFVYSEKSSTIELLLNINTVKNWCTANNAKLILISAFDNNMYRQNFINVLRGEIHDDNTLSREPHRIEKMVDTVNWDTFLYPNGRSCVTDLLLALENKEDLIKLDEPGNFLVYYKLFDKMSNYGYITKCGHPSQKGHEELAKIIYEHIIKNELTKKNKKLL